MTVEAETCVPLPEATLRPRTEQAALGGARRGLPRTPPLCCRTRIAVKWLRGSGRLGGGVIFGAGRRHRPVTIPPSRTNPLAALYLPGAPLRRHVPSPAHWETHVSIACRSSCGFRSPGKDQARLEKDGPRLGGVSCRHSPGVGGGRNLVCRPNKPDPNRIWVAVVAFCVI